MNIRAFAEALPAEFYVWGSLNAIPYDVRRYADVLETTQGMTTPSTMHLLNLAVRHMAPDECYLEVGTWRGATLIGALLGNDYVRGIAIDDDSMDEHDGDDRSSQAVWYENIEQFNMGHRAQYVNGIVPAIWETLKLPMPIGVYLFDGDKSTDEAAYAGIVGALPFLADEALIFLDDTNDVHIRMAAWKLCANYPRNAIKILDLPTPGNCWPMFWNGIMAIAWKRA